jgi:hypothetical protein
MWTVFVAMLVGVGVFTGKIRVTAQPSTDSAPAAARDYLKGRTLSMASGSIQVGGVSLLFVGPDNKYETARLAVNLPAGTTFVDGTFGDHGKSWCVHVKTEGKDLFTTNYYEKTNDAGTSWACAPEGLLGFKATS